MCRVVGSPASTQLRPDPEPASGAQEPQPQRSPNQAGQTDGCVLPGRVIPPQYSRGPSAGTIQCSCMEKDLPPHFYGFCAPTPTSHRGRAHIYRSNRKSIQNKTNGFVANENCACGCGQCVRAGTQAGVGGPCQKKEELAFPLEGWGGRLGALEVGHAPGPARAAGRPAEPSVQCRDLGRGPH